MDEKNEFVIRDELKTKRESIKTFDDLCEFLKDVKDNYNCGYGAAPRSIAQAASAVAWFLSSEFGITGFQASFIMWDFIRDYMYKENKTGMKIINYDDMLYPQYDYKFDKVISKETFAELQREAERRLDEAKDGGTAHSAVIKHWKSIASGKVPFGYKIKDT